MSVPASEKQESRRRPFAAVGRVVRATPFTVSFVVVFLVVGLVSQSLFAPAESRPWFPSVATGVPAFQEGSWWSVFTSSFFLTPPYAYLFVTPLLIVGLGWAEMRLGTWRTIVIALCGHLVGVLGAAAVSSLLGQTGWHWGELLAASYDVGPSCAGFAALVFAIATLPSPWRLRARLVVGIWAGISVLYLGRIDDLEHAVAIAGALLVSGALPAFRHPAGRPTVREWRLIGFWSIIAIGVIVDLREAFVLIANIGQEIVDPLVEFTAIWTMLLSWAMFNWGYARIYYARYHRAAVPPLEFPSTESPRLTDFVYFAFTNATTFAVSDVRVTSSRLRWTVAWHTMFAFFFNALIIVLTMNVIAKGHLFSALFTA